MCRWLFGWVSPVDNDGHRESEDENTDESTEAADQLGREFSESSNGAQVVASSPEINFFRHVCASKVEDWRGGSTLLNEFWSSGVPNFVFSFQGKGGKREEERGAMGNFCLRRCFSGLRPDEISFHAPSKIPQ